MGKLLFISDKHIGNKRNPSQRMVKGIKSLFEGLKDRFKEIDAIVDLGDSSDRLLNTNSIEYRDYLDIHLYIASLCVKYNMDYIYLYGTPLHEMNQFDTIYHLIKRVYPTLNIYLLKDIEIFHYERLNLNILTIPDEVIKDNRELESRVENLIKRNGLNSVDLILSHTIYKHHIDIPLPNIRDPDLFLSKLGEDGFLLNGHIHTHSIYKSKLITVGSTDRIAHNEEEDKGIGILHINHPLSYYEFIPNRDALKFITYKGKDNLNSIRVYLDKLSKETDLAYVRFQESSLITPTLIKELNSNYENLILEYKEKKRRREIKIKPKRELKKFEITKDNIYNLLKDRVKIPHLKEIVDRHIKEL